MSEVKYSEKSIFLELLSSVMQASGGVARLRAIVAPLWGDAESIQNFYDDADKCHNDPAWLGVECLEIVATALAKADVPVPPRPHTSEDPLALSPDGKVYADPAAANKIMASLMTANADPAALAAVQNAPAVEPRSNLEPAAQVAVPVDSGVHIAGE